MAQSASGAFALINDGKSVFYPNRSFGTALFADAATDTAHLALAFGDGAFVAGGAGYGIFADSGQKDDQTFGAGGDARAASVTKRGINVRHAVFLGECGVRAFFNTTPQTRAGI